MASLSCARLTLFAIIGVIVQFIGLLIFLYGFFPVKPALSGVSGVESFGSPRLDFARNDSYGEENLSPEKLRTLYQERSEIASTYDRLVLLVIDGLPAEFVLGKNGNPPRIEFVEAMPYTRALLEKGTALGFHSKAAPPTVTMPRLKAMVSGAIGGFLDVAFNFQTQAMLDDNLLGQFRTTGRRMVMHGDETWLKLFPGLFIRHDGVTSFFVKDTVTVDQNVSRHLPHELSTSDWDLLILHYLGLDHVGHIGGRSSILMPPKMMEMDEVIRMVHTSRILNQTNDQEKILLLVVSDHGMTENGNHGGSTYEETDSLALFIGLENDVSAFENTINQVDITPTLALLFGVPIPINNVGILIPEMFEHLPDEQKLRALELNSWQLLRLLQAQIPTLSCGNFLYCASSDEVSRISECQGSMEEMFCCLFKKALCLHNSWVSKNVSRTGNEFINDEEFHAAVEVYHEFLKAASQWLARRVTYKPINLLALGVGAILLSCLILLSLLYQVSKQARYIKMSHNPENNISNTLHIDEAFTIAIIFIFLISMGSSSMVEEEQYVWHFVTSSLTLLLLRRAFQSLRIGRNGFETSSVILILVSQRILRGWHQGGVNWTFLPDISKWLEKAGDDYVKATQLITAVIVITMSLVSLSLSKITTKFKAVLGIFCLIPGFLVLNHIGNYQDNCDATSFVQSVYMILGVFTLGIAVISPWISPCLTSKSCLILKKLTSDHDERSRSFSVELRNTLFVIGWAYICSWCFLQLFLQQPINSMPVSLLFIQILVGMLYSLYSGPNHKQWVEVALFYYMGMAGHYALGNSNSLATIDVAGAFIGISSHSTFLSGILMFIITYASLMFTFLSMVMYISVKSVDCVAMSSNLSPGEFLKAVLGVPCLLPLSLNSIFLIGYTIMLILMRNHLFVWSVFSPKYLYVCATTACIYIGVFVVASTVIYTFLVISHRRILLVRPSSIQTNKN